MVPVNEQCTTGLFRQLNCAKVKRFCNNMYKPWITIPSDLSIYLWLGVILLNKSFFYKVDILEMGRKNNLCGYFLAVAL